MRILIAKLTILTAMALVLFGIKTGLAISPDGWESAWDADKKPTLKAVGE